MGAENKGPKDQARERAGGYASLFPYRDNLPGVVEAMLSKLDSRDTVRHVCQYPLPGEETVVRTLDLLAEVLFPGYFGKKALDQANLPFHIGETISLAYDLLVQEMTRCVMHERHCAGKMDRRQCEEEGHRQAFRLLERLPDVLGLLDGDVRAAYQGDPAATGYDEVIFCYPGFRAVLIYRIAHEIHRLGIPWLPRMMTEYAHAVTGIDIHPGATIGGHFFMDHGTGVVIGETSEIGDNVRMYQGVTLGGYHFKTDQTGQLVRGYKRHPTIEDDVIIYSNASVLGPITVGKGAVIGANVILTHPVEPGAVINIERPRHRISQRGGGPGAD